MIDHRIKRSLAVVRRNLSMVRRAVKRRIFIVRLWTKQRDFGSIFVSPNVTFVAIAITY